MNEPEDRDAIEGNDSPNGWRARHEAHVVRFRLREVLDHLERGDTAEAQAGLKRWADRLDLGAVPNDVRSMTVEEVASALAFMRQTPRDLAAAAAAVERAFRLWV